MATTTDNLGLKKPEETDKLVDSLSDFNSNADLLDRIIGKLSELNTAQKESLVAAINEALTKVASVTLSASGWDADAKTQTVSVAGVTAGTNGSLRIAQSVTDEQFAAWGAAQPRVTAQADGSITVKLAGTVPEIDIPVEVLIV